MIPRQIGWEPAALVALCILTIFFFPVVEGPYSAVHGPVTALQAARLASRLKVAIVQAARNYVSNCLIAPLVVVSWIPAQSSGTGPAGLANSGTVLRC